MFGVEIVFALNFDPSVFHQFLIILIHVRRNTYTKTANAFEDFTQFYTWNLSLPKAVSHVRMTSAARPINRVWYDNNLLMHSKIQSNLPFKMTHLTLILLLLDFVCCFAVFKVSSLLKRSKMINCTLTFPDGSCETHMPKPTYNAINIDYDFA